MLEHVINVMAKVLELLQYLWKRADEMLASYGKAISDHLHLLFRQWQMNTGHSISADHERFGQRLSGGRIIQGNKKFYFIFFVGKIKVLKRNKCVLKYPALYYQLFDNCSHVAFALGIKN